MFTTVSNAQFAAKAGVNLAPLSTNDDGIDISSKLGFVVLKSMQNASQL